MKKNESKIISGELLRQMVISGGNNLFNHYPEIDSLNVFPVPDGDTGTNMNLSITSGIKEISNIRNNNIGEVSKMFSRGLLMGARGNSGVILSQIFRGFAKYLEGKETASIEDFAHAWENGKAVAYKAVMKPVEGTILTVIREASDALVQSLHEEMNITEALEVLYENATKSLKHTPELLPVLKEVGVVDSGGAGLCKIIEGMLLVCNGSFVERKQISVHINGKHNENNYSSYLVHFIIKKKVQVGNKPFDIEAFKKTISRTGRNPLVQYRDDFVKVSVECERPGMVLNSAQNYGEFLDISIEPTEKPEEMISDSYFEEQTPSKPLEIALISTSVGPGLDELFKSLNVSYIVPGGQTMNPSTEDFVDAIKKANAKNVIILPNNKNILMAAQQACECSENINCKVVPTKTIMQGIVASMMFVPDLDMDSNFRDMSNAITTVKSGQVTFSIKDTKIDDVDIVKGHYMGICNDKIVCCIENKHDSCFELVSKMIDDESSLVTIIYGEDVSKEEAQQLADKITSKFPVDIEIHKGGQPVYSYYVGVE